MFGKKKNEDAKEKKEKVKKTKKDKKTKEEKDNNTKEEINIAPIQADSNVDLDAPNVSSSQMMNQTMPNMQPQAGLQQPQAPGMAMQQTQPVIPTNGFSAAGESAIGVGTTNVNYNNIMPGSNGSMQQEVTLPDDPSVIVERREKVERPLRRYSYVIINSLGKKEKGNFDAESENDVRNFLLSQNFQVLEVKERSKYDIDLDGNKKIGANDLSFALTQLSTYIKSGIPLADSVKILAKQTRKATLKKSFNQLVYQLLKGESLSDAMIMQDKVYPKLVGNMVKTSEMTGDLPSILDDMAEYYTSMDQTRKQMKSAMTYPIVVLTIAFGVLIFMLTYLVPQFSSMFEANGAELPALTKTILNISKFVKTKWMFLFGGIGLFIFIFAELYSRIQKFRQTVQIILMHLPVVKNIIIYNEIANFTKTFASLLNHGVFITDSMEILSKITNNEVYKRIINTTLENLGKGDSISSAFRGEWAVPVVAYEMIVTGETTGQLGAMMEKVAGHFQSLHKNTIDSMKSLVEPALICFLAVVVGIILISIVQPMFSIYSQIK